MSHLQAGIGGEVVYLLAICFILNYIFEKNGLSEVKTGYARHTLPHRS